MRVKLVLILLLAVTSVAAASGAVLGESVFRVAMQPIVQIDPALISSDAEVAVANAAYDYLVDVDAESRIIPRLAASWTVSEDGTEYTFVLPEGIHFHDGSPLVPGDVVWTFDRLRDPANGFATESVYSNIERIDVTGPREVRFRLAQPNPFFLYDLSDNHALIVKRGTTDFSTFNGTGPFVVEDYRPEDRIVFRANEDYFIEGVPMLDGLEFIFFGDQVAAVDALRGGQVDMAWRMSSALFLTLQGEPGIVAVDVPTNGFDLVRLRNDIPPGNDPAVLEAMKLATDREAIFQIVQLGLGAVGRDSPIGPLYAAYYDESTPIPARDADAARDILANAGYPDGLTIDLYSPDTGGRPDLAVVLKEQWADAGITVNVIVEPESVYYGENHWMDKELGITGWGSRPYPQFYMNSMLTCEAAWNESRFCDAEFDALAAVAGTTLDEAERVAAYADIQRILIERGPVIIPYFFAAVAAYSDGFDGVELKAFPGRTDLRVVVEK
jgi:peptide/nickel transport system substrate-binding protein